MLVAFVADLCSSSRRLGPERTMTIKTTLVLSASAVVLCACSSMVKKSIALQPGMSREQVTQVMGTPSGRSFRRTDEAWQYQQVAGFGQCAYVTVWFSQGAVVAVTDRRGPSVAGCGLGSQEVDWGQMPKATINVNVRTSTAQ